MIWTRIGTAFYVLWGLLHLYAGYGTWQLAQAASTDALRARVEQMGVYLVVIAVAVLYVAVRHGWRGERFGYWFNLWLVSIADVIFLAVVVIPGHIPLERGLPGPVLWILALVFTTIGYRSSTSPRSA